MAGHKSSEIAADKVRQFEKTEAQLEGFFEEIGNLSKKKPDDAVNTFKLNFINQILVSSNDILGDEYRPFRDFEKFDIDAIPTTSDVVTMLSQYLRSMDKFRKDHSSIGGGQYYWNLPGDNNMLNDSARIRAKRPKDI